MHKRWHIVVRQLACLSVRMHTAAAIAAGSLHDEVAYCCSLVKHPDTWLHLMLRKQWQRCIWRPCAGQHDDRIHTHSSSRMLTNTS